MAATADQIQAHVDKHDACLFAAEATTDAIHAGDYAKAHDMAELLLRLINGDPTSRCLECGAPLTVDEQDRFTSWCYRDAPALTISFDQPEGQDEGVTARIR